MLYEYTGAGHGVNSLVPYEPGVAYYSGTGNVYGDTRLANPNADARLWPEVLSFLADPSGRTGTFNAPATPPALNAS